MTARGVRSVVLVALSVAATACSFEHTRELTTPTMPSLGESSMPAGTSGLAGLWTSETFTNPESWDCGNFQWEITEETPTSLAGSFAGTCGIIVMQGAGNAQINGDVVTLNVSGEASAGGIITTCPFSLNATGQLEGSDAIRVNYSGTTCFGPVDGSETLRRAALGGYLPGNPPPEPPPPPPPPPPSAGPAHVGPGPLTGARAYAILEATSAEYPHLAGLHPTDQQAVAAAEELLRRYIWHLQLAGFQAGRQRNPSGAISNDKLTIFLDGRWRAYDVFFDYGVAGKKTQLIFFEVSPPSHVPDGGIPD